MNLVTRVPLSKKFEGNVRVNERVIAALDALPHTIGKVKPGAVRAGDGTSLRSSIVVLEGCSKRNNYCAAINIRYFLPFYAGPDFNDGNPAKPSTDPCVPLRPAGNGSCIYTTRIGRRRSADDNVRLRMRI